MHLLDTKPGLYTADTRQGSARLSRAAYPSDWRYAQRDIVKHKTRVADADSRRFPVAWQPGPGGPRAAAGVPARLGGLPRDGRVVQGEHPPPVETAMYISSTPLSHFDRVVLHFECDLASL